MSAHAPVNDGLRGDLRRRGDGAGPAAAGGGVGAESASALVGCLFPRRFGAAGSRLKCARASLSRRWRRATTWTLVELGTTEPLVPGYEVYSQPRWFVWSITAVAFASFSLLLAVLCAAR